VSESVTAPAPPAAPEGTYDAAESFLGVVWRRTRYVLAIALSAGLFSWLGWKIAAPPPEWAGVSLGTWQNHSVLSALLLAAILLLATAVCSLIVHPDSPHMGLFCSLLGMAGLSIRGGSVHLLMVYGQTTGTMTRIADAMAVECVEWGCVILLADAFARFIHDKFLSNHYWLLRAEPEAGKRALAKTKLGLAVGFSETVSRVLRTNRLKGWPRIPLAMIWSGLFGLLFLYVFMQSQLKGQVVMACFVSFLVSTICAYAAFPTVPFWALILAVPLTGAAGYLLGRNGVALFPGHAPFYTMRALPIDYLTAGVPGAILGLYWSLNWSLNSDES
jgi:hypothetical protein